MGQPRMVPGVPAAFAAARWAFTSVFPHQRILEVSSWRCWTRGLVGPCFLCRSFGVCACCSAPVFAWAVSCVGTDAASGLWLFFCFYFFCKEELELDDSDASPPVTQDSFWERVFPRVGEALARCRMRCARGKGMLRPLQGSWAVVGPKPSVQVWASAGAVC